MKKYYIAILKFVMFFLLIAFVVTCNFNLFLSSIHLEPEEIRAAAPITFLNVIFLTFLFCLVDSVRRQWMVERPVRRIQEGIDRIVKGDFKTRIAYFHGLDSMNAFDEIIKGLNQMAEELGSVETLRTDFIANVSHELKTPLTVIQNLGTLLQSPNLSDEKRIEYGKLVTEQTRKLSSLIMNILKLNKLENQQIFPNTEAYNIGEQLAECMIVFEDVWEEKNIQIDVDIDEDIQVVADKELLSLVWNNLISNAIKFTDDGGRVSVSLKKEKDKVVVRVSDTGCGMDEETGKNIFKKFYQGDTSHATQGNGLGLSLVKRVIDIIGGDIKVTSKVGVGSTFIISLGRNYNE